MRILDSLCTNLIIHRGWWFSNTKLFYFPMGSWECLVYFSNGTNSLRNSFGEDFLCKRRFWEVVFMEKENSKNQLLCSVGMNKYTNFRCSLQEKCTSPITIIGCHRLKRSSSILSNFYFETLIFITVLKYNSRGKSLEKRCTILFDFLNFHLTIWLFFLLLFDFLTFFLTFSRRKRLRAPQISRPNFPTNAHRP